MRKNKNTISKEPKKNRKRDIGIIIFLLLGAAGSLFLFWRDLNTSLSKNSETPIGTVSDKYKAVQRRFADRLMWDRLQRKSLVYNGDVIRTAELSDVSISFEKESVIALGENSLIQIFADQDGIRIELSGGTLSAQVKEGSGTALTIKAGKNQIKVSEGGMINLRSDSTQGLNLEVLEGNASLNTPEGVQGVEAGSALAVDEAGELKTTPQVAALFPRPNQGIVSTRETSEPVHFSWNPINFTGDESVRIEVAADRGFTRVVQHLEVADKTEVSLDLPTGNYWWRVYPVSAAGEGLPQTEAEALTYKLTIRPPDNLELISPRDGSHYQFQEKIPPIEFAWTAPQGDQRSAYLLEVANNPAMQNPQFSAPVQGTFLTSSKIGAGTWYWRVTPVYSGDYTGEVRGSSVASFKVEPRDALSPPSLIAPTVGSLVNLAPKERDERIFFSWKNEPEATGYTIQIGTDREFKNPLITKKVQNDFYAYRADENILQEGAYFWRVWYTGFTGTPSPSSEVRSFIALKGAAKPEAVFPPPDYTVEERVLKDLAFTWTNNLPISSRFQISSDGNFTRLLVNKPVEGSSYTGQTLPVGSYYWRITFAITPEGTAEGSVLHTSPRRVMVVPPLPSPTLEAPQGPIHPHSPESQEFRWQPVPDAEGYQFTLYSNDGGQETTAQKPVYEERTQANALSLSKDVLGDGSYSWTVQAIRNESPRSSLRESLPATGQFWLDKLKPVLLESPSSGKVINGLDAYRNPINLRWSSREPIAKSRFILSQNRNPLRGRPVMDISNPDRTIKLNRLGAGTYYWIIQAETPKGIDISAPVPASFQVLPIALVPVSLDFPKKGQTFTNLEAQKNAITPRWSVAERVGKSRFILSRNPNPLQGQAVLDIPNPSRSVSLPKLEEGTYYWTIQAETRDGLNISASAPASFRILPPVKLTSVSLDFPKGGQTFTNLEAQKNAITPRWSAAEPVGKSRFILSRNPNPLQGQSILDIPNPSRSISLPKLEEGTYYWTIQAETPEGLNISAPAPVSFQILPPNALNPVSLDFPKGGQTFTNLEAQKNAITPRWNATEPVGKSRFILSRNPNPLQGQAVLDIPNPSRSISLPKLEEGTYYWTIQAETPEGLNISAPTPASFQILPPVKLTPVSLDFPKGGQTFTNLEAQKNAITPRWSAAEPVGKSRFILSRNPNPLQGQAILDIPNPNRSISLPKLEEGTYYWTIQAETPEGLNISAPVPASFQILPPIALNPVSLDFPRGGQTFTGLEALRNPLVLRWSAAEPVGKSRFVLSRNPNPLQGQAILDIPNPNRSISLPKLPEGTYYWTIQAETPDGLNISASAPVSFQILPVPLLPSPQGLRPADRYHITGPYLQENQHIIFEWNPVPGATGYRFTLSKASSRERPLVQTDPIPQTRYVLNNLSILDPGDFIWQVEALSIARDGSIEQRGVIAEYRFTVDIPLPANPVLQAPGILYGN